MRRFPIMAIKNDVKLGFLGVEECSYRMMGRFKDEPRSETDSDDM
jgi:hypothetical protein